MPERLEDHCQASAVNMMSEHEHDTGEYELDTDIEREHDTGAASFPDMEVNQDDAPSSMLIQSCTLLNCIPAASGAHEECQWCVGP